MKNRITKTRLNICQIHILPTYLKSKKIINEEKQKSQNQMS